MDIKKHVGVFKNLFPEQYCKELIEFFEEVKEWQYSRMDHWTDPNNPNSALLAQDISIELDTIYFENKNNNKKISDKSKKFLDYLFKILSSAYKEYLYAIRVPEHSFEITGFKIQKTNPTEGYHIWHSEFPQEVNKEWDKNLNKWGIQRMYTREGVYTLYLNDVEEGGETEFLIQSMRTKPTTGTLCIFPAAMTHMHRGNPPLSGVKYIITGWYNIIGDNEDDKEKEETKEEYKKENKKEK